MQRIKELALFQGHFMSTADTAWQEMLDSEKIHEDGQGFTSRDIIVAMLHAYAKLQKHREKTVSGVMSMSRDDYEKYKRKGDPHWRTIHLYAGSWTNAKKVLPVPSEELTRKNRRGDDATAYKFAEALHAIAQYYGIKPHEVSIRQFMRYKKEHPEDNLANFKVYSKYIAQSNKWDDAKAIALSGIGRKKVLGG